MLGGMYQRKNIKAASSFIEYENEQLRESGAFTAVRQLGVFLKLE
jgi:hypothetical protein